MAIHGHPGGFVTAATPTVTTSSAQGIWTKAKQLVYQAAGTWPPLPFSGGQLWTWGDGSGGVTGLGNTTAYSSPKQVGALTTWASISLGSSSSGANKTDGTLWSWGVNSYGQLGLGNTTAYSSPKQVGSLTTWALSSFATRRTAAIKTDGTLWTWGQNLTGELGLGDVSNRSSPVQVGVLTGWSKVSASGAKHMLAVKTNGTLWSWGSGYAGVLGLGNTTNYSSPKQVGALTTWSNVFTNSNYDSFAIKTDGTLWAWGKNSYPGVLGLGNTTAYSSPKQVGALTNWATVGAGNSHTLAVKTDGTLWSWGRGSYGRLGLGNTTNYTSPKQVGALTAWSLVNGGFSFSSAIKTDGTLWAWGKNTDGQLGLGNTTNYSSPKQVGALTTWSRLGAGSYASTAFGIKSP
jgi:alpha-tubulin suppressor-like RCC1 family protein